MGSKTAATTHGGKPSDLGIGWQWLEALGSEIYDTAYSKGWYEEDRTVGDRIALIHSEISEALEEHRDGHHLSEIYYKHECALADWNEKWLDKPECTCTPKPEGVGVELADAVIRILDFCDAENIPLGEAMRVKMAYNETRSHRHGGKAL